MQQRGGFGCIQRAATRRERSLDDRPGGGGIDGDQFRRIGRGFHQGDPVLLVAPALHERSDGIVGRVVGGNAPIQETLPGGAGAVRAQPARQHPRPAAADGKSLHGFNHGGGGRLGRNQRVRRVQDQHAVELARSQQRLQRGGHPVGTGIAAQIERILGNDPRRQNPADRDLGLPAEPGQAPAFRQQGIGGQQAEPPAVADNRQPVAGRRQVERQSFGGPKQLPQRPDPQHPGPAERGVVNRIGLMGCGIAPPAGPDHQHRLDARRRPRRREERADPLQCLQIQQDGAGIGIAGQPIQQVAEIDIGAFAERDDAGKTDALGGGPFDHRRQHRSRLRDQGQMARPGPQMAERGVEPAARHDDAEAVRAEQPQAVRPGSVPQSAVENRRFIGAMPAGRGGDHRDFGAAPAQFGQQAGNGRRRSGDHRQFRRARQIGRARIGRHFQNAPVPAVDQEQLALETAVQQVAGQRRAQRTGPLAGADQRDRGGIEQIPQMADRHRRNPDTGMVGIYGEAGENATAGRSAARQSSNGAPARVNGARLYLVERADAAPIAGPAPVFCRPARSPSGDPEQAPQTP